MMAEENVTVVILLNNENIPKDVFQNTVDEYFGPQVEDFKRSSLSICVLSDKTGISPSKANAAVFLKSQWLFQTILVPGVIFEFKLVISENHTWNIILSEDLFENRLIETFKIPDDKVIVVHLEWNKPHTVSVESMVELFAMDESLIKSYYENQNVSESSKNLETINEDNYDDESLLDFDYDKSKNSNEGNDTDDSLEIGNEFQKKKLEPSNDKPSEKPYHKIDAFDVNIAKDENENLQSINENKFEPTTESEEEIFKKKAARKTILLCKIQSILGVKSELKKIMSTNILKEENITNSNDLHEKISLNTDNLQKNENIILVRENNETEYEVPQDLHFPEPSINNALSCMSNGNELYTAIATESVSPLDRENEMVADSSIHSSEMNLCSSQNFETIKTENKPMTQTEFSDMEKLENNKTEELTLRDNLSIIPLTMKNNDLFIKENSANLESCEKCESPNAVTAKMISDSDENLIESENDAILSAENPNVILTQPHSCLLVTPLDEVKIINDIEFLKVKNTLENVAAEFYHENVILPLILQNDVVFHQLKISESIDKNINEIEDEINDININLNKHESCFTEYETNKFESISLSDLDNHKLTNDEFLAEPTADFKETLEENVIVSNDDVIEDENKSTSDYNSENRVDNAEISILNEVILTKNDSIDNFEPNRNEIKLYDATNTRENFMQISNVNENQINESNELVSNQEIKISPELSNENINEQTTEEIKPTVSSIIHKFENLHDAEPNSRKSVVEKEKDKNRISLIVKQFENLNTHDEIKTTDGLKAIDNQIKMDKEYNGFSIGQETIQINNTERNETSTETTSNINNNQINKERNQNHTETTGKTNDNLSNTEKLSELVVNDDYKYPDSVTPTKVEHGLSSSKAYDVPFIDDEVFLKENSFREDKELSNKTDIIGLNIARETIFKNTPKASIETLKEIEIEKIKQSIELEQPVKKKKGILDLCGCVGGRKRS